MSTVTSRDGTEIAYDRSGTGPALVLVDGAMCHRGFGPMRALAALLLADFTVLAYDRRGRGDSGDARHYSVEREVEDLAAVLSQADRTAFVYGVSSGGALALEAAASGVAISKLALYEPPFTTPDDGSPDNTYQQRLQELLEDGRRGDAVELFLSTVGLPSEMIAGMRQAPVWPMMEGIAPTLAYDGAIMNDGRVPRERLASVTVPTLVLAGERSPEPLRKAATMTAEAIPHADSRILAGQGHDVAAEALAPVLKEFFQ